MADSPVVHFQVNATVTSVTCKFLSAGAYVGSAFNMSNAPSGSKWWELTDADLSTLGAGEYHYEILEDGTIVATGTLLWDGSTRDLLVVEAQEVSAAQIRSAVGMTAANLDTQLGDIPTVSEFNARSLPTANYAEVTDLPTGFSSVLVDGNGINAIPMGAILTIASGSTVSSLNVTAPANIDLAHVEDAVIVCNTDGRSKAVVRVNGASGTAPNLVLPVTPDLPETPQIGDTFILGPKYVDTGSL